MPKQLTDVQVVGLFKAMYPRSFAVLEKLAVDEGIKPENLADATAYAVAGVLQDFTPQEMQEVEDQIIALGPEEVK